MNKEIWKDIPHFEGYYQASNKGQIRSLDRIVERKNHKMKKKGLILNQHLSNSGYYWVCLCKNKIQYKGRFVHRLILKTFIGVSKLECNHKNGVKTDNHIENLEYVTPFQNQIHAVKNGLKKDNIPVKQYTKNGNLLNTYFSMSEASRQTGIKTACISLCVNNKLKTAGKYIWKRAISI